MSVWRRLGFVSCGNVNCKDYDEDLFLEMDKKLDLLFIEAGGNRFTIQTYNSIRDYMSISAKKALTKKGRSDEVIREHKAIVEAFSQRNAKKVEEAIKNI